MRMFVKNMNFKLMKKKICKNNELKMYRYYKRMLSLLDNIRGVGEESGIKEEPRKEKEEKVVKKMKLLSQGTYGCVFRPGIECSNNQLTTKKYITKVQKNKKTSEHEVGLGKEIKKIVGYHQYYAPIIESCSLKIGNINNDEDVKKCKIIDNVLGKDDKYEANKIPYVGKNTLLENVYNETQKVSSVESYLKRYINKHIVLLKGITKLNDAGIVHLDIKENNIMCRDKSGRPILIDFGLSVNIKKLESKEIEAREPFYSYSVEYGSWCLDILMISYMVNETKNATVNNEKKEAWRDEKATVEEMKKVIREYVGENVGLLEVLSSEEKEKYKKDMEEYYTPLIEGGMMNIPTWGNLYDELIKHHKSWDNYGVSIMFCNMLKILGIEKLVKEIPFMKKYLEILKGVIVSMPDKRPTSGETQKEIENELRKVSRVDQKKMKNLLSIEFMNIDKNNNRNKSIMEKKLQSLNESSIYRGNLMKMK